MNIKDGSKICYHGSGEQYYEKLYMWGWLGNEKRGPGWKDIVVKNQVIKRLKTLEAKDHYCGSHECEMCEKVPGRIIWENSFCGSVYVKYKGIVYHAPYGVEHYIEKHDYKPPEEVIEAILNGSESCRQDYEGHGITLEQLEGTHERRPRREGVQKIKRVAVNTAKESIRKEEDRTVLKKLLDKWSI
jgi:hypothetical protein